MGVTELTAVPAVRLAQLIATRRVSAVEVVEAHLRRIAVGAQLVARPWRDDVALAAALWLERELGGWRPPTPARASPAPAARSA